MLKLLKNSTIALVAIVLPLLVNAVTPDKPVFNVPKLNNIVIDGKADDWGKNGFSVNILSLLDEKPQLVEDYDIRFKLGWCERGLLVFTTVSDDTNVENDQLINLWNGDAVELWVSAKSAPPSWYKVTIAPGVGETYTEMRMSYDDYRSNKETQPKLKAEAARVKTAVGYNIEALLPWENLNITPKEGLNVDFQLYGDDNDNNSHTVAMWYPLPRAFMFPENMHTIRLAKKTSPPVNAIANCDSFSSDKAKINIWADPSLAGVNIEARQGENVVANGLLENHAGRAFGSITVPASSTTILTDLFVKGKSVAQVSTDTEDTLFRVYRELTLNFDMPIFSANLFPTPFFENPILAENLLGMYTIKTDFYNANFEKVTQAESIGRYGAVVTVTPENGQSFRYYRTLYKAENSAQKPAFATADNLRLSLSPENDVSPEITSAYSYSIRSYLQQSFNIPQAVLAPLVASIHEIKTPVEKVTKQNDLMAIDRQWWVDFKRKESGMDKVYPKPFVCPTPADKPGTVLRPGTDVEAGMKPGTTEKVDALLTRWAGDTDEAFAVCLARNGVVFLHKAYGTRNGQPFNLEWKSWMASITKLISATLFWEVVDQGIASVDDPVSKYIPALRGIDVKTPLIMRHLYTHTGGLENVWADSNNLDNNVALVYPKLDIGTHFQYNGTGPNLASTAVEMITGEALPFSIYNHLLKPLGCESTDINDSQGGAISIPMDIAKIGQLILNGGTYGGNKYFSPETLSKMKPRSLIDLIGQGTTMEWGIGLTLMPEPGLSPKTIGHGAASAATFKIDPDNQLIIVMTRNAGGRNYYQYFPEFIKTITEGL